MHLPNIEKKQDIGDRKSALVFLLKLCHYNRLMTETTTDYDSPWKAIIERYFEAFMAFFFPQAHKAIDWEKGYTFLDKELQQVVREAETGPRRIVLFTRFGRVPESIVNLIDQIDNLEILDELHRQAVTVDSLAAFEQLLDGDEAS